MNFSAAFGGHHFSTPIPSIHQFAAKFSQESTSAAAAATTTILPSSGAQENTNRYTANGVPSFTQHHHASTQPQMLATINGSGKYQGNYINQVYGQHAVRQEKRQYEPQELAQELCAAMLQQSQQIEKQTENKIKPEAPDRKSALIQPQLQQPSLQQPQIQTTQSHNANQTTSSQTTWQTLTSPVSTVADYLSHLPASTLPLSLHHFLKYSAESVKKENVGQQSTVQRTMSQNPSENNASILSSSMNGVANNNSLNSNLGNLGNNLGLSSLSTINTAQLQNGATPPKKKKKKKPEKEKKPRPKPGEIRLTTALDGSTLYCCPECHMAYPEKELLEQHLVGHTLERRFVCDICGAGLKRKDHLTRHKQSHNPERPYVCTVCLKAFKRKEQLTLHFVIHSGEKRHVCTECGKGFYRKDHLRKHTRSHIARRVKAELSQQGNSSQSLQIHVPPQSNPSTTGIMS
nr:unnamed protein product [Callosobruchus chinensis]